MISDIEAAVLGLIQEGHSYGYELEKTIEERHMRTWTEIAFSSIYYVLKKLEKQELISSSSKNVNGRTRNVYSITAKGINEMEEKVKNLVSEYHTLTDPFDLGLSNLDKIPPEDTLASLESYHKSLEVHQEYLKQRLIEVEEKGWPLRIKGQINRSLKKINAEKEWVNEFILEMRALFQKEEFM
ncbi:winged helix DNA-binding protein [Candidatus Bathyarchaeota archaeon]|nr:winged helix DNA-binding protein [Candidatus Bathyarchaeota archaeon]